MYLKKLCKLLNDVKSSQIPGYNLLKNDEWKIIKIQCHKDIGKSCPIELKLFMMQYIYHSQFFIEHFISNLVDAQDSKRPRIQLIEIEKYIDNFLNFIKKYSEDEIQVKIANDVFFTKSLEYPNSVTNRLLKLISIERETSRNLLENLKATLKVCKVPIPPSSSINMSFIFRWKTILNSLDAEYK